jgi:hypothetical protein
MLGFHIIELQKKLTDTQKQQYDQQIQLLLEARQFHLQEQQTHHIPYLRMRTAAINEAARLVKEYGVCPAEAANTLSLSVSAVQAATARMQERDQARRRFQATGYPGESEGGYLAIIK